LNIAMTPPERRAAALARLRDPAAQAQIRQRIAWLDAQAAPAITWIAGEERAVNARRVGVLAGSFNPPTIAHVDLAERARAADRLDVVIWSISRVTVDKETVTRAPLEDRLIVLSALCDQTPAMAVAVVNRGLYADQAEALRAALPQASELAFILGFDKIVQVVDPHYYADRDAALDRLFSLTDVLVAPRGTATERDLADLFARPDLQRWAAHVRALPFDPALRAISSTGVRERLARDEPVDDEVPPEALALADAQKI
jgi:nicotinic acid mononucleotide adenylyltransferase